MRRIMFLDKDGVGDGAPWPVPLGCRSYSWSRSTCCFARPVGIALPSWSRTSAKLRKIRDLEKLRRSVELCAVYWHFLLLVWLVLFGLLLFT